MKARVLAVSVLSLAMLFATYQSVSAQSKDSACAVVSISIVTGTPTVAPGTTISIGGGIQNCSSRKARYTLAVSAMSSCGQRADIASSRLAFNPGENKIWFVSYQMPVSTCAGSWEASVQVRDSQNNGAAPTGDTTTSLATASTTLTVQ